MRRRLTDDSIELREGFRTDIGAAAPAPSDAKLVHVIVLNCPDCNTPFPAALNDEFLQQIAAAGIEPEQLQQEILNGLASRRILCKNCERGTRN